VRSLVAATTSNRGVASRRISPRVSRNRELHVTVLPMLFRAFLVLTLVQRCALNFTAKLGAVCRVRFILREVVMARMNKPRSSCTHAWVHADCKTATRAAVTLILQVYVCTPAEYCYVRYVGQCKGRSLGKLSIVTANATLG